MADYWCALFLPTEAVSHANGCFVRQQSTDFLAARCSMFAGGTPNYNLW